ncbi:SDR family oxidoreductase [Chromobacterium vaccinii]|nr:SDR family oxidoreductase [Chromobacterium vaccinii]
MHAFIVTGASRGLGYAICETLLSDGYFAVGIARNAGPALEGLAARHPERLLAVNADLADAAQATASIHTALQQLPLPECATITLINNAGLVTPIAQAGHYPTDEVVKAVAVNVTAPLLTTDALLSATDHLPARRRILNISSGAAAKAYPGWSVYCATKASLDHFSRSVAVEQEGKANPARIVALYPGVVDTDMQSNIRASDEGQFPQKARFDALKSDGALSSPGDAARKIVDYLVSPAFGQLQVVDIREL